MQRFARTINAIMIFVIVGILLSAYYQQYSKEEMPCPLCILQRLGLISAGFGAFLNLWFGIRPIHYTVTLLSAMVGGTVSIRQICLHICPGSPTFGVPVLGLSLYTWAFIAFICILFVAGILLALLRMEQKKLKTNWFEYSACITLILITLSNFVTTFMECGLSACKG
ncbi:MAG: disulfide bond formation protein B [Simkaniaceae bacterium]|nr:disulfide bond formation protein B [Simkaniaceae bacterium]MCF7852111.1 disulfide bond formation protein B [Simkaniaceae bacterium]